MHFDAALKPNITFPVPARCLFSVFASIEHYKSYLVSSQYCN